MVDLTGLYFVIASEECARFVRPDPANVLHTVSMIELAAAPDADVGSGDLTPTGESKEPDGTEQTHSHALLARRIDEDFTVDLFASGPGGTSSFLGELTTMLSLPPPGSVCSEVWPRISRASRIWNCGRISFPGFSLPTRRCLEVGPGGEGLGSRVRMGSAGRK